MILKLPVEGSNANMSLWGDACGWHVRDDCEVYKSDARKEFVREMGAREKDNYVR